MSHALLDQAKKAKEDGQLPDRTQGGGDFGYETPAKGATAARFIGYVEIGEREQGEYQGQPKPPAMEAWFFFELLGKKHAKEIEVNGEKKTIYPIHREKVPVKGGERSNYTKLIKCMAYGRDMTHPAEFLNEAFLIHVVHSEPSGEKKTVYANIRTKDKGWLVGAPMYNANTDPLGEEDMQPLPVPEATAPLKLLLWESPTIEQWQSIFIDGTRMVKKKVDGVEVEEEVSKNWMQEAIMAEALDFNGSALEALVLENGGVSFDGGKAEADAEDPKPEDTPDEKPADGGDVDPLDALGLT